MSRRESMSWLLTGAALWAVATATLAEFGGGGVLFRWYWPAVAIICAGFVGFFLLMLRWRKAPAFARLTAATCLALPGMVGEVPVLLTFPAMVPSFGEADAGSFGAFLFCGYSALFAAALWPGLFQAPGTASHGDSEPRA